MNFEIYNGTKHWLYGAGGWPVGYGKGNLNCRTRATKKLAKLGPHHISKGGEGKSGSDELRRSITEGRHRGSSRLVEPPSERGIEQNGINDPLTKLS